jgi:hypothetical protein
MVVLVAPVVTLTLRREPRVTAALLVPVVTVVPVPTVTRTTATAATAVTAVTPVRWAPLGPDRLRVLTVRAPMAVPAVRAVPA